MRSRFYYPGCGGVMNEGQRRNIEKVSKLLAASGGGSPVCAVLRKCRAQEMWTTAIYAG